MDITHLENIICEIWFIPVWVFDEVQGTLQHLLLPVSLSVRSETEKYKRYRCKDHNLGMTSQKLISSLVCDVFNVLNNMLSTEKCDRINKISFEVTYHKITITKSIIFSFKGP